MDTSKPFPKKWMFLFLALSLALGNFLVADFGEALASRPATISSRFLPLVLHQATSPAVVGGKVMIADLSFQPAEITIHLGESLEWENKDQFSHTTTSDTGLWDSGELTPGKKFTFQFKTLGDYPYHCEIHPMMTGIVHVIPNP